jgi:hypothetical protein
MTVMYSDGNILDVKNGIICHQVNHRGVANAGLAKQIRAKYPEFMEDYLRICKKYSFEYIREYGTVSWYKVNSALCIASIFGQDGFGRDKVYTDYYSLKFGLQTVMRMSAFEKINVFIPHGIGCGLAGGNWDIVNGIINDVFKYSDCHVWIVKLKSE